MSLLAVATVVLAMVDGLDLRWAAPPECPSEDDVRALVDEHLDGHMLPGEVAVHATASAGRRGWSVVLELQTNSGPRQRVVPPQPSCRAAAQASALIIAIALDPTLGGEPLASPEVKPKLVVPPSLLARPPLDDAAPQDATEERADESVESDDAPTSSVPPAQPTVGPPTRGAIHGLVGVAWNVFPRLALIAGGGASFLWRRATLRSFAHVAVPQRLAVSSASLQFHHFAVGLVGGPRFSFARDRVDLELALGFEAGRLWTRSWGFTGPDRTHQPWVAWLLEPALTIAPARWLALGLRGRLLGPLIRPRYRIGDGVLVHQPGVVGLAGLFFLEGRFP